MTRPVGAPVLLTKRRAPSINQTQIRTFIHNINLPILCPWWRHDQQTRGDTQEGFCLDLRDLYFPTPSDDQSGYSLFIFRPHRRDRILAPTRELILWKAEKARQNQYSSHMRTIREPSPRYLLFPRNVREKFLRIALISITPTTICYGTSSMKKPSNSALLGRGQ